MSDQNIHWCWGYHKPLTTIFQLVGLLGRDSGNDFFVSQILNGSGTFRFFYFCFFFSFPNVSKNENINDFFIEEDILRNGNGIGNEKSFPLSLLLGS